MGFGIDRRARSRKGKGLFRRAPDPKDVGQRLAFLLLRMKGCSSRQAQTNDRFVAEVTFHPKAPPARLVVNSEAELSVKAQTSTLGPGYHASVLAKLEPVLDELDFVWAEPEPDPAAGMCKWLASELATDDQVIIGLSEARTFICDAPVMTPLGPRDEAWRAAVLADPMKAADAFPWWKSGDGYSDLANALLAMWQEVPWREPLDNAETDLMEQVEGQLAAAKAAGVTELPYPEWAELLGWLGRDDKAATEIMKLAGDRKATIGYRRLDMEIALSGGWVIQVPAAFAGRWDDEDARYLASDGERAIEFTSLTAEDETDSQKLLDVAPESHQVIDRFTDGDRVGRAEASDEDDFHLVHGLVAHAPHVAILTLKGRKSDEPWALKTWRSLRRED
ncbi:MAG TPA: hypothetical protein VF403_07680 [Kofleriaceae bacterium]